MSARKVLVVGGYRIFPAMTGGMLRTTAIARALARMGCNVTVYALAGRREDYRHRGEAVGRHLRTPIEARLVMETHVGPVTGLAQAVSRRLGLPRFWQYALLRLGLVPRRLRELLREADIVLCDSPLAPPVPGPWSGKPHFLISHNLEFALLRQGNAVERRFAPWMERIERAAPARYRDILVCSQQERDFFHACAGGAGRQLPLLRNGVDAQAYTPLAGDRRRLREELGIAEDEWLLIFTASAWTPNVEALETLRAFCREEAAFLAERRLRFVAVGSVCAAPCREGPFLATGGVAAVVPYLAAADVALNPVVRGSGSNVKIFEYVAAGLPVISTAFGVRGTEFAPDRDYLPYEPGRLRAALERLLASGTREQWRERAAQVLARHIRSIDMQELVRDALGARPEFRG